MIVRDESCADNPFVETVQLPSRGYYYDGAMPDGYVKMRPMTVREEKLMLGKGAHNELFDRVLTACICSNSVDLDDMLMTDKMFLLMQLRRMTYGAELRFENTCSVCGTKHRHSAVLPEGLRLKVSLPTDVEPFEVKLPVSEAVLTCRFLRGKDEKAAVQYRASVMAGNFDDGDPVYEFMLSRYIVSINGVPTDNNMSALEFARNMHSRDAWALRMAIEDHESGMDLRVSLTCPSCKHSEEVDAPLTANFFPKRLR